MTAVVPRLDTGCVIDVRDTALAIVAQRFHRRARIPANGAYDVVVQQLLSAIPTQKLDAGLRGPAQLLCAVETGYQHNMNRFVHDVTTSH